MRDSKKQTYILSVVVIILLLGLGYAYLNSNLSINGTTNITSSSWNIYWNNIQVKTGSVTDVTTPATIQSGNTLVVFNVNLKEPGDYYEFTVDAVNNGSIDAMIGDLTQGVYASNGTTPKTLPDYLEYTVTYSDGVAIAQNHLLAHNTTETYKVRVYFKEDINASQLPSTDDNFVFKFGVEYVQASDSTQPVRVDADFETDSWDDIVTSYNAGRITNLEQAMNDGTTREVQLDLDNDGTAETTAHLRIANLSTPSECFTAGFSQTACGLVIEFADVITTHRMNPYINGDTTTNGVNNKGGWEYSDMRAYLNSTTYSYENIDYSTSGMFNALPNDLKNKIINTKVVSGYGKYDSVNYITTDKLYLLDVKEIYGTSYTGGYFTAIDFERQLDYYETQGVTTSNYRGAQKSGTNWWLRSAYLYYNDVFFALNGLGACETMYSAYSTRGVSPAFRIG